MTVKLDRCAGTFNNLNDLSNKVCSPNKAEDIDLSIFNMTTCINEPKTLTEHISCECKCKPNQWWNKKVHISQKDYVLNPATCNCENGKNLASVMDDSTIICDKIINVKKNKF